MACFVCITKLLSNYRCKYYQNNSKHIKYHLTANPNRLAELTRMAADGDWFFSWPLLGKRWTFKWALASWFWNLVKQYETRKSWASLTRLGSSMLHSSVFWGWVPIKSLPAITVGWTSISYNLRFTPGFWPLHHFYVYVYICVYIYIYACI